MSTLSLSTLTAAELPQEHACADGSGFEDIVKDQVPLVERAVRPGELDRATRSWAFSREFPQDTGHGSTFQMAVAYSAMVRSLENLPDAATFRITLRAQASGSAYSWSSR